MKKLALRENSGDWIYYLTSLSYKEVLENVKKIVGLIDEFRPNITSSSKLSSSRIKPFRKYND